MAGRHRITVTLEAATKNLSRSLSKLSDELGGSKLAAGARKAGKVITNGLKAAGTAGAAALGVALYKGFQRLSGIDQAEAKLRGLGHTSQAVGGIMDNALASVKGTAFGLDEAATTAAGAVAAGIKPGKDLERVLGLTADTATIAGSSMGEMGAIFNKVAASNRLSMGEVNQLADRGVPIMQMLADQYGVTAGEARKMVERGEVDFAAFSTALEDNIAGAALESGKTVSGAWANMQAALGRVGAQLLSGIFPQLAGGFGGITEILDSLAPVAEKVGEKVGAFIADQAERLGPVLADAGAWIRDTALPALQEFGEYVATTLGPKLEELGTFIQDTVLPAVSELASWVADSLVPALMDAAAWINQNRAWLEPLAVALGTVVGAFVVMTKTLAVWRAATAAAAAAQALLNASLLANPIAWIIALVVALVAGIVYLWKTNDGFRNAIIAAWRAITAGLKAAWSWIQGLPAKFSGMMTRVRSVVSSGIAAVVAFFARLPARVLSAIVSMPGRVAATGTRAMSQLRSRVVSGISNLLSLFRGLPSRILGALGNLGGTLAGAGRQLIDGLLGSIRGGFDRVRGTLGRLTNLLPSWKGPASRDRNLLRPAGRLIIDGLVRGLRQELPTVRRTLGTLTEEIARTDMPELRAGVEVGPGGLRAAGPGQTVVKLEVNALAPSHEVGQAVVQALREYGRLNGVEVSLA